MIKNKLLLVLITFFSGLILIASVKGYAKSPDDNELNTKKWKEDGPFELSPERGRYALLYSIVEDNSFFFSLPIARFATPDLGIKNEKYVSLFAPGVSFLLIPGYLIGKTLGASQVGAFLTISFFAIINFLLIQSISQKIGATKIASILAGIIFLFATPAFSYSTTIYQHHVSVFLILSSIRILLNKNISFLSSFLIYFILFLSIPVDYPNLILSLPILMVLFLTYIKLNKSAKEVKISINVFKLTSVIGAVIPILLVMYFNINSYGKYFQFASTSGGVQAIDENGKPTAPKTANFEDVEQFINPESKQRSAVNFFKSRHMLNSINILLFSVDRGVVIYTPVIIFGIIGLFLFKKKVGYVTSGLLISIVLFNIVIYSMRGDAWGGWAFGSRYLIPAYAILAIPLSLALTKFAKKLYFIIPFWILLIYSTGVNTLGAITTNAIPPKTEVLELEKLSNRKERYSFDRNWEFLNNRKSKSFVYQTWMYKYLSSIQYFYLISGSIMVVSTILTVGLILNKNEKN